MADVASILESPLREPPSVIKAPLMDADIDRGGKAGGSFAREGTGSRLAARARMPGRSAASQHGAGNRTGSDCCDEGRVQVLPVPAPATRTDGLSWPPTDGDRDCRYGPAPHAREAAGLPPRMPATAAGVS